MKYLGYSTHAVKGVIRAIRENPHRFFRILGLCSLALFAIAHSGVYADAIIDDAFITFRHTLNILRGEGYTCNPGERIEGTSSFLLTFISVIPIALGIDPLQFSKGLGRLAFAGCTVVTYLSVRTCLAGRISYYLGFGAAILIASSSALAFHSQTGLETLVYAFLFSALPSAIRFRRIVRLCDSAFSPRHLHSPTSLQLNQVFSSSFFTVSCRLITVNAKLLVGLRRSFAIVKPPPSPHSNLHGRLSDLTSQALSVQ
jgi:hypothetical protein